MPIFVASVFNAQLLTQAVFLFVHFYRDQVDTASIIMTYFRKIHVSNLVLNINFLTEACQNLLGHSGETTFSRPRKYILPKPFHLVLLI